MCYQEGQGQLPIAERARFISSHLRSMSHLIGLLISLAESFVSC